MPFSASSHLSPITYIIVVAVAVAAQYLTQLLNKKKNAAKYLELENKSAEEVTHAWIKSQARYRVLFGFWVVLGIIGLMVGVVILNITSSDTVIIAFAITGFILLFIRMSIQWMKIIYLKNLSLDKQAEVKAYFNNNLKIVGENVLADPEIVTYLNSKPKLLRKLVERAMRRLAPIS